MGSGYGANCAYVIEVTPEIKRKMGITEEELTDHFEDPELLLEKIRTFFGVESGVDLYMHNEGDRYDDLEEGKFYLLFSQALLFKPLVKTETHEQIIEKLGMEPVFNQWVTFG